MTKKTKRQESFEKAENDNYKSIQNLISKSKALNARKSRMRFNSKFATSVVNTGRTTPKYDSISNSHKKDEFSSGTTT